MIHAFGQPDPPVPRLLSALGGTATDGHSTLVLAPGTRADALAIGVLLDSWSRTERPRVLVIDTLGAHRDARAPRLRAMWDLEELARSTRMPVLTLRLGPLVGPASPFWLKLRSRPRLPRGGADLLNPVAEADVIETLSRALDGRAAWEGWYEVAGPEVLSLAELAALAAAAGPRLPGGAGAWEPPLAELAEHRLAEAEPWLAHFDLSPSPIAAAAPGWAA